MRSRHYAGTFLTSRAALDDYDPSSVLIFAAFTTPPTVARKELINKTVLALKAASIWTSIDVLYILAAADSQAASINWKNPGTNSLTTTATVTFTADDNAAGDGVSGFLDCNYNASTFGGAFTQDSAFAAGWSRTSGQANTSAVGWFDGTDGVTISPRTTNDNAGYRINQASQSNTSNGTVTDGVGFFAANRSASNAIQMYKNGSSIGSQSTVSTALNNHNFNAVGSAAAASFNTRAWAAVAFGGSLSAGNHLNLYNALNLYMAPLGIT